MQIVAPAVLTNLEVDRLVGCRHDSAGPPGLAETIALCSGEHRYVTRLEQRQVGDHELDRSVTSQRHDRPLWECDFGAPGLDPFRQVLIREVLLTRDEGDAIGLPRSGEEEARQLDGLGE